MEFGINFHLEITLPFRVVLLGIALTNDDDDDDDHDHGDF